MQEEQTIAPMATDDQQFFLPPSRGEIIKVALLGLGVGLAVPLFGYLLNRFFTQPIFCSGNQAAGLCANSPSIAYYAATVIGAVAAIVLLANWQVFRPLLIAVAVAAIFWGFREYVGALVNAGLWEFYALSGLLYTFAYLLFYWVMRVRNFGISLGLTIVLVVAIRWFLVQ